MRDKTKDNKNRCIMYICNNCCEIVDERICPICGHENDDLKNCELYSKAVMAVRYGYSYRRIAQTNGKDKRYSIHYSLPDTSECLLWLAGAILSGLAYDGVKKLAQKLWTAIRNKDVDKETKKVLAEEEEFKKFYSYIKDFEGGFSDIEEYEYEYIEEEMRADFCAEEESKIFEKEKRFATVKERIEIDKRVELRIKSIVKRDSVK